MRYGVVGDVHANLHALETAVEALRAAGAERLVCPGDLVGYGPRPNECVARLRELDVAAIAGNHDLMAIGRLPVEGLAPLQRTTIEWTRDAIDASTREYLEGLPLELPLGGGVVMTHGALGDPTRYVYDCTLARAQLDALTERHPDARTLLLGHTHLPLACSVRQELPPPDRGEVALDPDHGPWVVNAGSVGQSRERAPHARAMILDTDRAIAGFLALDYDVAATRRELRDAGLPAHACHLSPGTLRRARRRLVRVMRRG
jgi:predicted phosphodiesterase